MAAILDFKKMPTAENLKKRRMYALHGLKYPKMQKNVTILAKSTYPPLTSGLYVSLINVDDIQFLTTHFLDGPVMKEETHELQYQTKRKASAW